MGGNKNFNAKLDSVFTVPNKVKAGTYGRMIHEMTEMVMAKMGQYAHGNQPIQHMIYLYNYSGEPLEGLTACKRCNEQIVQLYSKWLSRR